MSIPVAIYTRKSTDAKTEQDVHSLSVQRASAEAFVKSREHLGWKALKEHFDDNNVSGATLERPALERLRQKVIAGEVKVIAINRLDRISRSLSQFIELSEFLQSHGVSIVSVTQNFNTGDSMGKLMLHILMSFSEFERSLIRDRVTERMHAARKKGRFIGGRPVLGYNIAPQGRELEVDEIEALRVKEIFELYLEIGSVKATVLELNERGWQTKRWVTKSGKVTGGSSFTQNGLHTMLTNKLYIGKVSLKGEVFDGQHEAILDEELFRQVQERLKENSVHQGNRKRNCHHALLKGLLYCSSCDEPFIHNYTKKKSRTYFYYTCKKRRDIGSHACPCLSLSAGEIESLVVEQLFAIGADPDLQAQVYSQLCMASQERVGEQQQQLEAAQRSLAKLENEIYKSVEFDAPLSLVRHLESKRDEAQKLIAKLTQDKAKVPTKKVVFSGLRNLRALWPKFTNPEKCQFARSLVKRVDYSHEDGKVTLHFNVLGFGFGEMGGAA